MSDTWLPAEKFCNPGEPLNPVKGDGALGNRKKGKMYYSGPDKEEHVKTVQKMLIELEYPAGQYGVDGDFGDDTESAVMKFQKDNKDWNGEPLKVDGLVGPETADALNRRMVGIWYDRYDTSLKLTENKPHIAAAASIVKQGLEIDAGDSADVTLVIVDDKLRIISEDFLVLTKKLLNASAVFEDTDVVKVWQEYEDAEFEYSFVEEPLKVFIRPGVIVISQFPKGMDGDAKIRVVDKNDTPKCEWLDCKVVTAPLKRKTVIPLGDTDKHFDIAIIANPAYGQANGSGPFTADEILKTRWAFHWKTLAILETFFNREEDLFRDPEIEPHMRFTTSFDDTLHATHDNALVELAKDPYMGPRSSKFPDLLPKFLKAAGLQADVVFAVSMLKRKQQGVGTDDGAATTKYTFLGKEYSHGKDTNCPGCIADTVWPIYLDDSDKIISMHEFLHAASSYYICHIIDLYNDSYNDYKGLYPPINKREKADKKDAIPEEFGEYNGVVYRSDRPEPGYKGRGGLGYGPDSPRKIEKTYGPELRDKAYPNVMDTCMDSEHPDRCKADTLTYQFVKDRIKAKLK